MRRRAEPELGPMPATLAALPLPSHGRWMDADGIPLLPLAELPWWATKGQSPQQPAWAAPAAPVRAITDQRPEPVPGPRLSKDPFGFAGLHHELFQLINAKAARAGVRLATLPHGLAGARVRRWRLLTCVRGGPSDAGRTAGSAREVRVRRKTKLLR